MLPWLLLGTADIPGGGQLRLMQRGGEFSIMLGGNELMNSRLSGSEEALATLVAARLGPGFTPRVLIGGLGMGFTLRAALTSFPAATIEVAELVPGVVAWARGPLAPVFGQCLDDPRVTVRQADVGLLIRSQASAYDAILLDVDNGPDAITQEGNSELYSAAGLNAARSALHPGGMLAVWSAAPSASFLKRLHRANFKVEEIQVRARGNGRGARHTIWLAKKPGVASSAPESGRPGVASP